MRCPALTELPSPPTQLTGWPWTVECPQLPTVMPDGRNWPRISIITPNYNYGQYIEETIRSILLQGYPNLEYIIIDGGSTDESLAIIRKYAKHLTYWSSESDDGQAHAINKGLARITGNLVNWINSDDVLLPGALGSFGIAHGRHPNAVIAGDVQNFVDCTNSSTLIRQRNITLRNLIDDSDESCMWHQPGIFLPGSPTGSAGMLDEQLTYAFDLDLLCRLLQNLNVVYLNIPTIKFRVHERAKTALTNPAWLQEAFLVVQRYWDMIPGLNKAYVGAMYGAYQAGVCLAYEEPFKGRFFNRGAAARRLVSVWLQYPKIICHPLFLRLCLRAIFPVFIHHMVTKHKRVPPISPVREKTA